MNGFSPRRDNIPAPLRKHFAHGKSLLFSVMFICISMGLLQDAAQSQTMMPLPAYGNTYTASQIRGYWFQAPTDFIITGLRVPTDVGTAPQYIEVVKFTAAPPVYSASTSNYTVLGLFQNVNSTSVISTWIDISAGDYIAIFGTRSTNNSTHNNSYGTPAGQYTSNILGYPVTLTRMVYQGSAFPVQAVSQEVGAAVARTEMYYIPPITGPNDAGVSSIDSPLNFCAGTHPVTVTLKNFGTNQLTSSTIQWTINGTLQTPVSWTGMLDTTNPAARATTVSLGNHTFASNVSYTIKAWATLPNGVADTVARNDTSTVTVKAAMSGVFTIGTAGADYSTFAAAVADLNANGVCGPVTLKAQSGTYNEQISLKSIPGASAVNTITFESFTGNKNDVTLSYSGSSANNYVLDLNGCDYVTFKNMTLTATNTSYSRVVMWQAGAENCTLENLVLNGRNVTTTSTNYAVIYSPSGSLDHNATVRGCDINGGSYAVYWYGGGTTSLERGTLFENNNWNGFYYSALYMYYQDAPIVRGNDIFTMSTYTNYGVSMNYCDNQMQFVGNTVRLLGGSGTKYAVRVYYSDANAGQEGLIANNFITVHNGTSTTYPLYSYYSYYKKYYFNTIHTSSTSTSARCVYAYNGGNLDFQNNIFDNVGNGYAFYTNSTANVSASNDNVFNSNGSYLAYWGGNRATLNDLQTASGMDANSITKSIDFLSESSGDLHLAGASEDDPDLYGSFLPEVTDDIDGDTRRLPYRGADEACYIEPNTVWFDLTDGNGIPTPYINTPGTLGIHYHVAFPDYDATITITINLYAVPGNLLTWSDDFTVSKLQGQTLDGIEYMQIPSLGSGNYRVEAVFHTKNSCGNYRLYSPTDKSLMLLPQGQTPCIVWPGDVNNDGLLNYGDHKSLNQYIHDANLNPLWLQGPPRYRPDAAQNPLTYTVWEAQASVPWHTPEGCYMDADGNGIVNSFDYVVMKLNWMRAHDPGTPKSGDQFNARTFDMSQNFPNPFNPTTQIQFSVPERSRVEITVVDMLGRTVATLASGTYEEGVHTATFDADGYSSGVFTATAVMTGEDSGLSFTKTIRMNLTK